MNRIVVRPLDSLHPTLTSIGEEKRLNWKFKRGLKKVRLDEFVEGILLLSTQIDSITLLHINHAGLEIGCDG